MWVFDISDKNDWYYYLIRWAVMVVLIISLTSIIIGFGYINKDVKNDWLHMSDVMNIAYTYIACWCIIIFLILFLTLFSTPPRTK